MDAAHVWIPLSRVVLDDPAFSPDPRLHPHFPLADACSYRTARPVSSSTSPACSSTTSHSQSPPHPRASPVSSPPSLLNLSSKPPPPPPLLPRADTVLKSLSTNIPRKARMRALVRRLTTRRNLDRIDELDETDPFGRSYHHDGPYEAIGSNLAHPFLPGNTAPCRANIHLSKREPRLYPLPPRQHQLSSAHGEAGLSLHLEPGQILQPNTIYSPRATAVSGQFLAQPGTVLATTRPDPSQRQSLPNPRPRPCEGPLYLDSRGGFQNHHLSSLSTSRERYLGDYTPDISDTPPLHHDHVTAPYDRQQTKRTTLPPPQYESKLHSLSPLRSPQRTPPPSSNPTPSRAWPTESMVSGPRHDSRHKTVHSLDSSRTIDGMSAQPSSIRSELLDPPRIRHLPKRLVMPAPLQSQPPQLHYEFPPAKSPTLQDAYPDDHALDSAHFEGRLAMYSQEPRLLRKKSSAFPAKTPIPDHAPVSQDDVSITEISPTKTGNEVEGTKEKTRRRRLSKRKNGI